jgi:hypothetical protein
VKAAPDDALGLAADLRGLLNYLHGLQNQVKAAP